MSSNERMCEAVPHQTAPYGGCHCAVCVTERHTLTSIDEVAATPNRPTDDDLERWSEKEFDPFTVMLADECIRLRKSLVAANAMREWFDKYAPESSDVSRWPEATRVCANFDAAKETDHA